MCGRYFISPEDIHIQAIMDDIINSGNYNNELKSGDVFPTNLAPIIGELNGAVVPQSAIWGFHGFKGSEVLINARAETAVDKRTFKESLLHRRCVIPCSGFYEWDERKRKYAFRMPDDEPIYLGGFYKDYDDGRRFMVLTASANESVIDVHRRMPLIVPQKAEYEWLTNKDFALEYLHAELPLLQKFTMQ